MKAERRVLEIQTKLRCWVMDDPHRWFDDLINVVAGPAFLLVAWVRVWATRGHARPVSMAGPLRRSKRTLGSRCSSIGCGCSWKDRTFRPVAVRERMIPKANGKRRRSGIPTVTDRVVQASLKLVLEPIFEAEFLPSHS
jgi:RNA-directed DNA polymerase